MTLYPGMTWYGVLNGVPLDTYGWRVVDKGYDELLNCPALRGEDLVMNGAKGRRPYPRIVDSTIVTIPLLVIGEFDKDGNRNDDHREGLVENRDYLRANLGLAEDGDPDDGTVPLVFHRGSLDPVQGPVTFLGFNGWTTIADDALTFLDLSIPDGELEVVGS